MHGFLLQVTHELVTEPRRQQVGQHVEIEEHDLGKGDQGLEKATGVLQLEEYEQVGALVLRLLQQMVDQSVVILQSAQGLQVSAHSSHHSRHTRKTLQEYNTVDPLLFVHLLLVVLGYQIKNTTNYSNTS